MAQLGYAFFLLLLFLCSVVFQLVRSIQIVGHPSFGSRKPGTSGMVAGLAVTAGMLPSETQAMEARHTSRLQLVENEVVIFQGKIKDKDANGGRDLFPVKKGFGSLTAF